MDVGDLRTLLRRTGADLWDLIDAALSLAARDHPTELRSRRDGIVERLYTAPSPAGGIDDALDKDTPQPTGSPSTPHSPNHNLDDDDDEQEPELRFRRNPNQIPDNNVDAEEDDDDVDVDDRDEKTMILAIKEHIEDPDQDEESLITLLQNLADMDITFKALKETDIGRHVNGLRKHPSGDVRGLVKFLVRKWKELVDNWVKLHSNEASAPSIITDGDSPQQASGKSSQNGLHVSERGHSPNLPNGDFVPDRNKWDSEPKTKPSGVRPMRPIKQKAAAPPLSSSAPSKAKEPREEDSLLDSARLASARKRLRDNYQEAKNAKQQRTIQVMDIHDIPNKKKNAFFPKPKPGRRW